MDRLCGASLDAVSLEHPVPELHDAAGVRGDGLGRQPGIALPLQAQRVLTAKAALVRVAMKMPVKTRFVARRTAV